MDMIVFLRWPEFGRVKTRLASKVGEEQALEIYKFLVVKTFDLLEDWKGTVHLFVAGLGYDDFLKLTLNELYSEFGYKKKVPNAFLYMQKENGDLGEKMSDAFRFRHRVGHPTIIIGTDCPYLKIAHLRDAINVLKRNDVVLVPASDGGYNLLGMKSFYPELFSEIPWSTSSVLSKTKDKISELGLRYSTLEVLDDIDEVEDWKKYQQESGLF
jgi:uncharacterized protein